VRQLLREKFPKFAGFVCIAAVRQVEFRAFRRVCAGISQAGGAAGDKMTIFGDLARHIPNWNQEL
jgi:hypothetical protein